MDGAHGGSTVPNTNSGANANPPPPFLSKTYDMVDDPSSDSIVSWSPSNNSFVVWNTPEFSRDLLPKYFKHNNFSSFVRQLNTYGFRKIDPDRWEFANEGFLRGQKHLLKSISRRKPSHAQTLPQQPQVQSSSVGVCVEVGKFGIEEEIERLKRDKNVLMQELVRLRQQQQATDNQLQTVGQRLQGMEQRQQQMMSFLAKAMQSPGFLAQLVQQNDSNRRIVGENKKRRLPKHEDNLVGERGPADGQIIKYQPLMSDAAKAMFKQILKLDPSPKLESSNASDGFLTDNALSTSEVLDTGSSSTRVSGVRLAEVAPSCSLSCVSVSSEFLGTSRPSAALSEVQSSASMPDKVTTAQVSDITSSTISVQDDPITPELPEIIFPELPQIQGVGLESDVDISNQSFVMPETEGVIIDPMAIGEDGTILIEQENFGEDTEMDNFFYGNDVSWEQFFSVSPISGDIEEAESNSQEGNTTKETESKPVNENYWNRVHHMDHLTEQMGLLTSKNKG